MSSNDIQLAFTPNLPAQPAPWQGGALGGFEAHPAQAAHIVALDGDHAIGGDAGEHLFADP